MNYLLSLGIGKVEKSGISAAKAVNTTPLIFFSYPSCVLLDIIGHYRWRHLGGECFFLHFHVRFSHVLLMHARCSKTPTQRSIREAVFFCKPPDRDKASASRKNKAI